MAVKSYTFPGRILSTTHWYKLINDLITCRTRRTHQTWRGTPQSQRWRYLTSQQQGKVRNRQEVHPHLPQKSLHLLQPVGKGNRQRQVAYVQGRNGIGCRHLQTRHKRHLFLHHWARISWNQSLGGNHQSTQKWRRIRLVGSAIWDRSAFHSYCIGKMQLLGHWQGELQISCRIDCD